MNGEEDYYKGISSRQLGATYTVVKGLYRIIGKLPEGETLDVVAVDGRRYDVESLSQLPRGLYIINGRKIMIH